MQLISLEQNNSSFKQTVPESRGGAREAWPLLFLDQTEAQRAEKNSWVNLPPPCPYLRVWMTAPRPLSQDLDTALANVTRIFIRTSNIALGSFLHFVVDTVN